MPIQKRATLIERIFKLIASANAAAWVQAFGAIVALGLTLYMSYDTQEEAKLKNLKLVVSYYDGLLVPLEGLSEACRNQDRLQLQYTSMMLDDMADIGRQIQLTELDSKDVGTVSSVRTFLSTMRMRTKFELSQVTISPGYGSTCVAVVPPFIEGLRKELERYAKRANISASDLMNMNRKALGDLSKGV